MVKAFFDTTREAFECFKWHLGINICHAREAGGVSIKFGRVRKFEAFREPTNIILRNGVDGSR